MADLEDAMLRYEDKREELLKLFETEDTDRSRQLNFRVAKLTLNELSSKWDAIIGPYKAFIKDKDDKLSQGHELLVENFQTEIARLCRPDSSGLSLSYNI